MMRSQSFHMADRLRFPAEADRSGRCVLFALSASRSMSSGEAARTAKAQT